MIEFVELKNFKCFKERKRFEFGQLNLLTGINGRGKSSLLQSVLILSQSIKRNSNVQKLIINDDLVQLGSYDDIKNSETPRSENIELSFGWNSEKLSFKFIEDENNSLIAKAINAGVLSNHSYSEETFFDFKNWIGELHYVSADRLGPQKYVDKTNLPNFVSVGPRGEHTTNILAQSIGLPNVNDVLYRGSDSASVIQQTIEWLSYILDGASIEVKGRDRESSILYLLLNNKNNSYKYKPANVGFGYSYILPLIVTGLIARPKETIILENPEAHLHPRAQSRIAEFFSIVASTGVQIFIESHSEHILNGLRVSGLDPSISLQHDEIVFHYFNELFDSRKLVMDEKGKIADWPYGFFDQQELDLAEIFRYSRKS